jgi:hypothetical protein
MVFTSQPERKSLRYKGALHSDHAKFGLGCQFIGCHCGQSIEVKISRSGNLFEIFNPISDYAKSKIFKTERFYSSTICCRYSCVAEI